MCSVSSASQISDMGFIPSRAAERHVMRITQHVGPILPPVRLKLNADVSSVITVTRHMVLHALHVGDVYQ